jgi:hypothetical protein
LARSATMVRRLVHPSERVIVMAALKEEGHRHADTFSRC